MYLTDLNESARAKLAEVQALGYTVDDYGLIADPGKFESEPFATPLLWQIGLEGFADTDESDEYQNCYEFEMSPAELADYGLDYGFDTKPLNGKTFYAQLSESDQGFVTLYMSQQSIAEMNGDDDDSDDPEPTPPNFFYTPELRFIYPQPERTFSQGEVSRTIAITDSVRVRITWEYDNDPDISWLGEFTDSPDAWVIDRKLGILFGEYETITKHLPPKRAEIWREEMEALGYDVSEYDSPMRGWLELEASGYKPVRTDLGRTCYDSRSYRYFKPSDMHNYCPPQNDEEIGYLLQDHKYMEAINDGNQWFMGVRATLIVDDLEIADSRGLWGIESEMTDSAKREYEAEQIHEFIGDIRQEAERLERAALSLKSIDPKTILEQFEEVDD